VHKALLIEDSPEFQLLVRATLAEDFEVTCSGDADAALSQIETTKFDIILIDVGLPGRDGLSLCEELRRNPLLKTTPILFVTGRKAPADLVQGFAVGADDYISKPFHPDELRARVRARIHRAKAGELALADAALSAPLQDTFWKSDLHFIVGRQSVMINEAGKGERDLNLTPNEFKILYHLAKNEEKTLTRTDILREVWGENLHVVERTVDKHICSLRRKMGSASRHVASVPGRGYVFHTTATATPQRRVAGISGN
jgi:DNA-binding response OmpR family regulator